MGKVGETWQRGGDLGVETKGGMHDRLEDCGRLQGGRDRRGKWVGRSVACSHGEADVLAAASLI